MGYNRTEWDFRLVDNWTKDHMNINGVYAVLTAGGSAVPLTIYTGADDSSAASNPGSISSGKIRFWTDSATTSIDLVIYTANGDAEYIRGITPSRHRIDIDPYRTNQQLWVPLTFNTTETTSGFTLVGPVSIEDILLYVSAIDDTETVDVGLDGTTTNDPNGLIALGDVATLGLVDLGPIVTTGSSEQYFSACTYGALLVDFLAGTDAATDVGSYRKKKLYIAESEIDANITSTGSAGSDTFYGFAVLDMVKLPT